MLLRQGVIHQLHLCNAFRSATEPDVLSKGHQLLIVGHNLPVALQAKSKPTALFSPQSCWTLFFTIRFRYQKTGYSRLTKEHPIMAPGPGPVTILLSKSPRWKPKMSRFFTWISMSVSLPRYNSKSVVTTTVGLLFCPGAVANL